MVHKCVRILARPLPCSSSKRHGESERQSGKGRGGSAPQTRLRGGAGDREQKRGETDTSLGLRTERNKCARLRMTPKCRSRKRTPQMARRDEGYSVLYVFPEKYSPDSLRVHRRDERQSYNNLAP
eukprot:scaffold189439_cov31-Tisochrysis_lutea.AAC.2